MFSYITINDRLNILVNAEVREQQFMMLNEQILLKSGISLNTPLKKKGSHKS